MGLRLVILLILLGFLSTVPMGLLNAANSELPPYEELAIEGPEESVDKNKDFPNDQNEEELYGQVGGCREFEVSCECSNPERTFVLPLGTVAVEIDSPPHPFGHEDVKPEPCLSPEQIDNLVETQGTFSCLREMGGGPNAFCKASWTCLLPCELSSQMTGI